MSHATRPQQLVEHALESSRSEQCFAIVHDTTGANLRWANNTLTTNGVMHSIDVTVIAFQGAGNASVSGTAASPEQVTALVEAADRAAAVADAAEDRAELLGGSESPDWDDAPVDTSITIFDSFAADLGEAFAQADAEDRILYGFVSHEMSTTYLGSSTGLRLRHVQPTGHYGCTGKDVGLTDSAWVGGATRDFKEVNASRMAADLTTRLGWGTRRVELPPGRYDTVLPPSTVADLLIDAYWSAGARTAADGQSVFSRPGGGTRVGEELVRPGVHLFSDPSYAGLECAPFMVTGGSSASRSVYDNGLPLARTAWIDDGRLAALLQTRHTADLTGLATTPAIDNLVLAVDGGTGTDLDLAAGMDDGLLLTCMWYIRDVDPADDAAHRSDPRRCLPRRGRRDHRRGEQLPLQREPGRRSPPVHPRGCHGPELLPGVGRGHVLPHRHPRPPGPGLQHEQREPGALSRTFVTVG